MALKPINIHWISTSSKPYWKYIQFSNQCCEPCLRHLKANKTSFNLTIVHFSIRGKLFIIRCEKELFFLFKSICFSMRMSIFIPACQNFYLYNRLNVSLSTCMSVFLSVCLSICLSLCMAVCLSNIYFIDLSFNQSICAFTC